MTKFCSALYLENLLTNTFAKLILRGGVSCMPAALLFAVKKTSRFQKCHAFGKIKDALENKIKYYYINVTNTTIFIPNKCSYKAD